MITFKTFFPSTGEGNKVSIPHNVAMIITTNCSCLVEWVQPMAEKGVKFTANDMAAIGRKTKFVNLTWCLSRVPQRVAEYNRIQAEKFARMQEEEKAKATLNYKR